MALHANGIVRLSCFLAMGNVVWVMACGASELTLAFQKTLGHSQAVCGIHDLKPVFPGRGGRMIKELCEAGERLVRPIGKWAASIFDNGMRERKTAGFQMALHTHLHLAVRWQPGR